VKEISRWREEDKPFLPSSGPCLEYPRGKCDKKFLGNERTSVGEKNTTQNLRKQHNNVIIIENRDFGFGKMVFEGNNPAKVDGRSSAKKREAQE